MLSNEARKIIIEAHEKGNKSKEIADIFGVDVSSINRLIRQYNETGSYKLRTHERGRKSSLSEKDKQNIAALINESPDITIDEIIEKLNINYITKQSGKSPEKWALFTKRNLFTLQSVNAPDMVDQRNEWINNLSKLDENKLVFLDEIKINF